MKRFVLFFFLAFSCITAFAEPAADVYTSDFKSGVEAYGKQDYPGAVKLFEGLANRGMESEAVYFNLGNSYYKTGLSGKALWAYERALLINPRSEDVRWNMQQMRNAVLTEKDRLDANPFLADVRNYLGYVSSQEISYAVWACAGTFALFGLLWLVFPALRGILVRILRLWIFVVCIVGAAAVLRWHDTRYPEAVIQHRTAVRYGPAETNSKGAVLAEGVKVSVRKQAGGWTFVRFGARQSGWLPSEAISVI